MGGGVRELLRDGGCRRLSMRSSAGKDLLLDIDVQGALQVMRKLPEAVSIFILPPSPQVLEMRLRNRSEAEHVTSEEVIERRLAEAKQEIEGVWDYKYALVNDGSTRRCRRCGRLFCLSGGCGTGCRRRRRAAGRVLLRPSCGRC